VLLSLLPVDNQSLNGGQKVLLEWHYRFGYLGMNQVQYMLRQFPFVELKFSVAEKCDLAVCEICEFDKTPRHFNYDQAYYL